MHGGVEELKAKLGCGVCGVDAYCSGQMAVGHGAAEHNSCTFTDWEAMGGRGRLAGMVESLGYRDLHLSTADPDEMENGDTLARYQYLAPDGCKLSQEVLVITHCGDQGKKDPKAG